jgi:mono/diheme cytochrome c family protein
MTRAILCAALLGCSGVAAAADPTSHISWTQTTVQAKPGQPKGYVQYEKSCVVCHGGGPARPGTRSLATKYQNKLPALLADRTDLQPQYIRTIVRQGIAVMPPFRKTELSDADLDAIVAYLTRKR